MKPSKQRSSNDLSMPFYPSNFWQEEMERMMNQFFNPQVKMQETDEEYIIQVFLPQEQLKDLDVILEHQRLVLKGERKEELESKNDQNNSTIWQQTYSSFYRILPIPEDVSKREIYTDYQEGQLLIFLPKKSEA